MIDRTLRHYRIVEKIGAGGMGDVYRASDTKLHRDVALKVLPDAVAKDPERRSRFEREARAIASLQHPNIVTIHAVESEGDTHFLVMELVDGRTLKELIPRDGLPLDAFFAYAIPLVDAVRFAHERSITHRDLKPANVMVDEEGRLRVLDFGLAKLMVEEAPPDQTVAHTEDTAVGQVVGTAAYMSPEQAEAKPVDARTDLFSLGVVLYEMATGERPFRGDTRMSTLSAVLRDHPPSVSERRSILPRHLGRIIGRCLEKDRERRFQSAKELRLELEALRDEVASTTGGGAGVTSSAAPAGPAAAPDTPSGSGSRSGAADTPSGTSSGSQTTSSSALTSTVSVPAFLPWAALIVVAALAIVFVMRGGKDSDPAQPAPPATATAQAPPAGEDSGLQMTVVFPFENLGPAEDEYFAIGIAEEISSRLASVSGLGVLSRTTATQYDRSGKTMREIHEDLGVGYVLEGSVRWAKSADGPGRVRITPRLVRAADDAQIWSRTYDRDMTDVFAVQSEIAGEVLAQLGVTLGADERGEVEARPTENFEAYQAYLQGLAGQERMQTPEEAVNDFRRAVELDPGFVDAWYQLATTELNLYFSLDSRSERLDSATEAVERLEELAPSSPEAQLARGSLFYYGFGEYDQALDLYRAALEQRPNDARSTAAVGYIYRRKGELDRAVDYLKAAHRLDPRGASSLTALAEIAMRQDRPEEAIARYRRVIELRPESGMGYMELAFAHLSEGDRESAREAISLVPPSARGMYGFSRSILAWLDGDAEGALRAADEVDTMNIPFLVVATEHWRAILLAIIHGREEARPRVVQLIEKVEPIVRELQGNHELCGWFAKMQAVAGNREASLEWMDRAEAAVARDRWTLPSVHLDRARTLALLGDADGAMDLLEELEARPSSPVSRNGVGFALEWYFLRGNPRYEAFVAGVR